MISISAFIHHRIQSRHRIDVDAMTFLSRLQKFGEHRQRIVGVIPNRNQIRNSHITKIRFLFPVSFTTEYKVGIAEFYLYMGFGADLLKNVVTTA